MALPFPGGLLGAGLVLGHTTHESARVWLRCEQASPHILSYSSPSLGTKSQTILPDETRDRTALVQLNELAPDHEYRLELRDAAGHSVLAPGLAPRLRTLPLQPERLCFGVMSCCLPFERAQQGALRSAPVTRIYDDMNDILSAHDARFVLNMGDQIYTDELSELHLWRRLAQSPGRADTDQARALFYEVYRGSWAVPGLQRLRARFPQYMVWDDHEIRDDWGSRPAWQGQAGALESAMWSAARDAYESYQHALNPPTAESVYHYSFRVGGSSFFVLDLRGQRSWERRQLLGDVQWRDLEAWLAETAGVEQRFLISSVPLHHVPERLIEAATRLLGDGPLAWLVPSTFYDRWCAARFAPELQRLIALLQSPRHAACPVTVLAGDIHIGAAATLRGAVPVQQWISSAVTTRSALHMRLASWLILRATNLASRWPLEHLFADLRNNFGVVEVDSQQQRATFHLYAWDGRRAVLAHTVATPAPAK